MDNTIQVLNIQINNMNSSRVMKMLQSYLQTDTLDVIDFVTMDTLLLSEEQDDLQKAIAKCDLVLPGDGAILKGSDIALEMTEKEIENHIIVKNLARYLDKKKKAIFLLTTSEEQMLRTGDYIRKNYRGICIAGAAVLEDDTNDEFIVNKINAAGADCIAAFLPSPGREIFATDNRAWMNAKVWIGLDSNLVTQESTPAKSIRTMAMRLLFRRKVVKEKRENVDN